VSIVAEIEDPANASLMLVAKAAALVELLMSTAAGATV